MQSYQGRRKGGEGREGGREGREGVGGEGMGGIKGVGVKCCFSHLYRSLCTWLIQTTENNILTSVCLCVCLVCICRAYDNN